MRLYLIAFASLALAATPPSFAEPTDSGAGGISTSDLGEVAPNGTSASELNDSEERLNKGPPTGSQEGTSKPSVANSADDGAEAAAAARRAAEQRRQLAYRKMQAQQADARRVAAEQRRQRAHRQMQAQQAAARRVAAQQRAAQHRRNQQRR
jgi:hypothetical protein